MEPCTALNGSSIAPLVCHLRQQDTIIVKTVCARSPTPRPRPPPATAAAAATRWRQARRGATVSDRGGGGTILAFGLSYFVSTSSSDGELTRYDGAEVGSSRSNAMSSSNVVHSFLLDLVIIERVCSKRAPHGAARQNPLPPTFCY